MEYEPNESNVPDAPAKPAVPFDPMKTPGIEIAKLAINTRVLLETDLEIMELRIVAPRDTVVQMVSTDPVLKKPILGRLVGSVWPTADNQLARRPGMVAKGMRLLFEFRNGTYESSLVRSARIIGDKWSYEVFEEA